MQDEWRMPLESGEGPLGLILCPSRELARQTWEIIEKHIGALADAGWPRLRNMLCIGGMDTKAMGDTIRQGVHIACCTPGRLKDLLSKRRMNLDICRYLCLDEADRMVRSPRHPRVPAVQNKAIRKFSLGFRVVIRKFIFL